MISAVVLTHNDEATLTRTLASLTWCNEIIVVDDQSLDSTVSIAKKHGARVFSRSLNNDFAAQRNFALGKATHNWVLFVDSDEEVPPILAKEIQEAVASLDVSGFYLRRQDVLWGREQRFGETSRVRLLRLAKKDAGKWERPVHEVWDVTGMVGTLQNPLYHFPHPNVAQFIEEIGRYSTINAAHFFREGVRVTFWHIPVYPAGKFFVNFVWRQGFRDGMPGALVAFMMSFHSFLTRAKLWLLWRKP